MAYRLKANERVPAGIRRIAREEIAKAAEQLGTSEGSRRDEAIHEARKSVKKVRALLRLMRSELGPAYRAENHRLQLIGRRLSEFRDSQAMIETLDSLEKKYGEPALDFNSVRRGLMERKARAEQQGLIDQVLGDMATSLAKLGKQVKAWRLRTEGFGAIRPGLEKTFRAGRDAMRVALQDPRPENYHELRKRVKDHWYDVRLLENLWTGDLKKYEKSLKELETWLGEDHNLVILRGTILSDPEICATTKNVNVLCETIARYQNELREKAMALSARVYEEKPRQFTRRMEQLWEQWKTRPKSVKRAGKQPRRVSGQNAA